MRRMPFMLFISLSQLAKAMTESNVKAIFVFGDSIVDSGNNDFLDTTSKANYYPYGVDFPAGATGRFTNGRNPVDVRSQLLGLPHFLPVFYDPLAKESAILSGVNYAAGGSGILVSTSELSNVPSLGQQVTNFIDSTLPDLESQLNGSAALSSFLSHSIFLFNSGGDDLSILCTESESANCFSIADTLVENFTQQLERLYNFGARKFVVFNLMPSGSNLFFRSKNNGSNLEYLNEADLYLNYKLKYALDDLTQDKPDFRFVYVDMFHIVTSMLNDPTAYEGVVPCSDRSAYLFYDAGHLTESPYVQLSTKAYFSELDTEVYPFNVNVLANLAPDVAASSRADQPWLDA